MSGSILDETKHALGILPDDDSYDVTIINHINTYLTHLTQLGVGPETGFFITGSQETWDEFFDSALLNSAKSYLALRVRNLFDAPKTGFEQASMDRQVEQLEFRLLSETDY